MKISKTFQLTPSINALSATQRTTRKKKWIIHSICYLLPFFLLLFNFRSQKSKWLWVLQQEIAPILYTHNEIYLSTVPAIIMTLSIVVVFSICGVMFVVIGNQIRQSETIMCTDKIDTIPWFPSPFLLKRFKRRISTTKGKKRT